MYIATSSGFLAQITRTIMDDINSQSRAVHVHITALYNIAKCIMYSPLALYYTLSSKRGQGRKTFIAVAGLRNHSKHWLIKGMTH